MFHDKFGRFDTIDTCDNSRHCSKTEQLTYSMRKRLYKKKTIISSYQICSCRTAQILTTLITLCVELLNSMFKFTVTEIVYSAEKSEWAVIQSGKHFHNVLLTKALTNEAVIWNLWLQLVVSRQLVVCNCVLYKLSENFAMLSSNDIM